MDITTADPLIGQLFDGRYRVDARVARGGMATVYMGFDTRLDRVVAIKVMHQSLAEDDAFVARFHREAKAAARLSHPNVVAIFDQGADTGRVFLVMEHVDGGTLRERLRSEGRLSPAVALGIIEPVLQALAAAHDAGLVHRDVKPENILISRDGRVKVADFGLARAVETTGMTTTGLLIGTVSYLAPEQVSTGRADQRSDVYAAGIVLFELLTGAPPYDGDTPLSVAYRHVNDSVPAPSSILVGVPRELDEVVLRATQRDPDARPASARDLLVGVRRAQQAVAAAGATTALRPIPDAPTLITPLPVRGQPANYTKVLRAPAPGRLPLAGPVRRRRRPSRAMKVSALLTLLFLVVAAVGYQLGLGGDNRGQDKPVDSSGQPTAAATTAAPTTAAAPAPTPPIVTARVLNMSRIPAEAKLREQGFVDVIKTAVYSETVAKDVVVEQRPLPDEQAQPGATAYLKVSRGPERIAVPNVLGKPLAEATAALIDLKLAAGPVTQQFDEKVAAGAVVSANPAPATSHKPGTAVSFVVSKGRQPIAVPTVKGEQYDAAAKVIAAAHLTAVRKDVYSETVKDGIVISQDPATGTRFRGDNVTLTVSKGRAPVKMPKVIGLSRSAAEKAIERVGLKVDFKDFEGERGKKVYRQVPAAGVLVDYGKTVTIYMD